MKKLRLNKREKTLFGFMALIFAVVLIVKTAVIPLGTLIQDSQRTRNEKQQLIKKYTSLLKQEKQFLSLYGGEADTFQNKTPKEAEAALFEEIKSIADRFRLKIGQIRPVGGEEGDGRSVSFDLEIAGEFEAIFRFIAQLENSPDFLIVSSLRLWPPGGNPRLLKCKLALRRPLR